MLDFRYPDFFSEIYPDSGGYLEIFGLYFYDIYSHPPANDTTPPKINR